MTIGYTLFKVVAKDSHGAWVAKIYECGSHFKAGKLFAAETALAPQSVYGWHDVQMKWVGVWPADESDEVEE